MWPDDCTVSTAYRNHALTADVTYLASCTALGLIEGWEAYPEAVAMNHMAVAMRKQIVFIKGDQA